MFPVIITYNVHVWQIHAATVQRQKILKQLKASIVESWVLSRYMNVLVHKNPKLLTDAAY
jgi:hypothetical protein